MLLEKKMGLVRTPKDELSGFHSRFMTCKGFACETKQV